MSVKLETAIEVVDWNQTPFRLQQTDEKAPTLRDVLVFAVRIPLQVDNNTNLEKKLARNTLVRRMFAGPEIELAQGEVQLLKDRVGYAFNVVDLVGRVTDLLDGKE